MVRLYVAEVCTPAQSASSLVMLSDGCRRTYPPDRLHTILLNGRRSWQGLSVPCRISAVKTPELLEQGRCALAAAFSGVACDLSPALLAGHCRSTTGAILIVSKTR